MQSEHETEKHEMQWQNLYGAHILLQKEPRVSFETKKVEPPLSIWIDFQLQDYRGNQRF